MRLFLTPLPNPFSADAEEERAEERVFNSS
jgi:hypothetical protein